MHGSDTPLEKKYAAPALEKGLDILELLATQSRRLSKTQIAQELGRSTSEIFRMLGCLESRGYIGEHAPGDGYRLTMRLHDLVNKWPPHAQLVSTALPEMRLLAEKTLQSCHLGVVNSGKLYIAAQADSPLPIGLTFKIGSEFPLLRTASGRVLLAFQSKKVSDFLMASLLRQEKNLSLEILHTRLDTIKEDGIEVSESDRVEGLIDLSCPITNAQDTAIAALTVPFLNLLTRDVDIESVTAQLKQTATAISDFMGAENLL